MTSVKRSQVLTADRFTVKTGACLRAQCDASTTQATSSGTIYWCYVGYLPKGTVIKRVRVGVSSLGTGAQTAEVGVFTGTGPPNFAAQTLTKVWASGSVDDLTVGTGFKGNTADNTVALRNDAHVWVGFRNAMASTQVTTHVLQRDWGQGHLMQTVGAGAMTGSNTFTGTPVTFTNNTSADVRGYT